MVSGAGGRQAVVLSEIECQGRHPQGVAPAGGISSAACVVVEQLVCSAGRLRHAAMN